MKYTVKYKRGLFWKTLKNVVEDGFFKDSKSRFFILENGESIEIPVAETLFWFFKERQEVIKKNKKTEN
jgi:hypothetical protein